MKKITFTRHTETRENRRCLLQGPDTGGFTKEGQIHLEKLKKRLAKQKFNAIYSSDMKRCTETTHYLFGTNKKICFSPLLREKNNGEYIGKEAKSIDWDCLSGSFETRKLPGGESLIDLKSRTIDFWNLVMNEKASDIMVVGHGAFLKVLFGTLMGKNLRQSIFGLHVDHCSLTTVKIFPNKSVRFLSVNDTAHLN